jgi:N4-gp56 family major capsid protein
MYNIEELAGNTITSSDVAAITPEIISEAFTAIAHKKVVFAQLFKTNRDILNKPGKQVVFPGATAAGGFTIGVPENTDITGLNASIGIESYNGTTITITKIGGYLNITRESIKYAMRDVIKDNIYEVGLQYKEAIDDMAYYTLIYGQYTSASAQKATISTGSSIGALASNVLYISAITTNPGVEAVDYVDGSIYFTSTLTSDCIVTFYTVTKPGIYVRSAQRKSSSEGITAWGLLEAKATMIGYGRDPKVAVMSFADIPNLLYDDKVDFLDSSAYGGREPLMNAEIGKLWGLKIITESRRLPRGVALVVDTDRMGYDVIKEDLEIFRDPVYERDAVSYYAYAERGFGVKDTLALAVVLGGTPDYPGTYPAS